MNEKAMNIHDGSKVGRADLAAMLDMSHSTFD